MEEEKAFPDEERKADSGVQGMIAIDDGESPDEFVCCICLDLLFKPIVLPCGHIACFWCVHISMSGLGDSHCPICRNTYIHFPSICQTLHFLLMKLYPTLYQDREKKSRAHEKEIRIFSPQFDIKFEEDSKIIDSTQILNQTHKDIVCPNAIDAFEVVEPVKKHSDHMNDDKILLSDVLCVACSQMLYRPVILHCGHAYCEPCVPEFSDNVLKCATCQCIHPSSFVKVCLELNTFLEKKFPKEYAARSTTKGENRTVETENTSSFSSLIQKALKQQQSELPIHFGVGCDTCGMFPIIGERYKCKDCSEAIGFDVCGECYRTCSSLPGRFNQQHTPDHNFLLIKRSDSYKNAGGRQAALGCALM